MRKIVGTVVPTQICQNLRHKGRKMKNIECNEDLTLYCNKVPCDVDVNPLREPCEGCPLELLVSNWIWRRKVSVQFTQSKETLQDVPR